MAGRADAFRRARRRGAAALRLSLIGIVPVHAAAQSIPALFTTEQTAVEISLVEHLEAAETGDPLPDIRFDGSPPNLHASSGWRVAPGPEGGAPSAWIDGRSAEVEVALSRPQPLEVSLDLAAPPIDAELPAPHVTLLWNGARVRTLEVPRDRGVIGVRISPRLQRPGPNRFTLAPSYWLDPTDEESIHSVLRVWRISFARATAAEPPPSGRVKRDGDTITQSAESVATFYEVLPAGARLRGQLVCAADGAACPVGWLSLIDAGGEQHDLGRFAAVTHRGGELDIDLANFAGQPVAISIRALMRPGTNTAPGAPLEWQRLRIEGRRSGAQEAAIAALRKPYNVLLVLFDSLRADRTEPYGSKLVRTPQLSRLATHGVQFAQAFANSSFTRSSVASMLSALYPDRHDVVSRQSSLPEDLPWLPEILRAHGYATMSIINNSHVGSAFGFGRGFDEVHEIYARRDVDRRNNTAPRDLAAAIWREHATPFLARAGAKPFFIYLHEIDPHLPYLPARPYDRLYEFGYSGALTSHSRIVAAINKRLLRLDTADSRYLTSQYGGEVTFMDEYLGWILDHLRETGRAEDTLVVFVADHGEEFLEHGKWGHMVTVYDEVLRIPFLLSLPGVLPQGQRVESPAQLVDLAPTVLDLIGRPPLAGAQGRSLLPAISVPEYGAGHPCFARVVLDLSLRDAVRLGRWKLVRETRRGDQGSSPILALYDTDSDPGESVNLWPGRQIAGRVLLQLLERHVRHGTSDDMAKTGDNQLRQENLDPAVLENLRKLGYME